jgi:hypothetical protein
VPETSHPNGSEGLRWRLRRTVDESNRNGQKPAGSSTGRSSSAAEWNVALLHVVRRLRLASTLGRLRLESVNVLRQIGPSRRQLAARLRSFVVSRYRSVEQQI